MAKEMKYYKMSIRIPCDSGGCWENIYISGKNLNISHPYLKRSHLWFDVGKDIESKLEEISKKEFEKIKKEKGPSQWFD